MGSIFLPKAMALQRKPLTALRDASTGEHLMTIGEACTKLRVGKTTLYRFIQRNELKSVTFGRRRLIREPDLKEFIALHQAEVAV